MTTSSDSKLSPAAFIGLSLTLVLIWGSAFTMTRVGVRYISPIWLVAFRLMIGTVVITAYMYARGHRFPALRDRRWLWYFVIGVTGSALPFFLASKGMITVDSGVSAIIVGIMPLVTIVLAHFFADERLTPAKLIGFVIGFLGVVVLFIPDDFSLSLVSDWRAQLLIMGAAVSYAITTIIAKRAPQTPSSVGGAMMTIGACLVATIAGVISGVPSEIPSALGLLMALGLGLGASGIATIIFLYFIDKAGPSNLAKVNYFVPLCSVILGVTFLNEAFSWRIVVSFGMILIGVMIARAGEKPPVAVA
ncbi:DMT family transporter [Litorimonas sp. RW-G-Af-16]|uniref:DMT family transporter n=1 Tax=Litorimonas sp. RW-G-Af-16 TaxID=3241168 RepID=UPI00390C5EE9